MDDMVLLTAVYVIATIILVIVNILSVREIRIQRKETNRPIIECYFTYSRKSYVFRIENEGNLIAKNIQIRTEEPFFNNSECLGAYELDRMMSATFDIAPKEHFDVYLGNLSNIIQKNKVHNYTVHYEDSNGNKYDTDSSINFNEYDWTEYSPDLISAIENVGCKIEKHR